MSEKNVTFVADIKNNNKPLYSYNYDEKQIFNPNLHL